ncbi:hypothetical protein CPB84DRAFT_1847513 [Gymnopilus junonius]|uniref:XLF-like N-terminal domain-containing protein n=1 Tax=Gymnopilus junonius TaxID=109634 RepID=A0A9P5NNX4_GYMJU|nr:hypothetical protein CPB84DRAFT_1847513 [Gymnopilus junonius]
MEEFTEEHAKLLLRKEWLVKVDSSKATPYLFKAYFSPADLSCFVIVTDTKSVWAEVLTSKLLARRWRACNQASPQPFAKSGDEDAWRENILDLITKAHTIGGLADLSFEIIDSNFADIAFELEYETFKWRWETYFLGHQRSSEIISKHLIFPLISLNHLSFSSAEALPSQTVDKLGRTARRTVDNHIKNALSKPRLATSISRMTAMFNFIPNLPPILSISEKPLLEIQQVKPEYTAPSKSAGSSSQQRHNSPVEKTTHKPENAVKTKPIESDSATESDEGEQEDVIKPSRAVSSVPSGTTPMSLANMFSPPPQAKAEASDSESSPHRPTKKAKPAAPSSTDDDSEHDNIKSRSTSAALGSGVKRTTRQPIKRGGKRF